VFRHNNRSYRCICYLADCNFPNIIRLLVLGNKLLNSLNILLLRILGAQVLELRPLVVLRLALWYHPRQYPSAATAISVGLKGEASYLEVEHAGLGSSVVLLAAALLEEAVDLC
jgi:hypothetical protein